MEEATRFGHFRLAAYMKNYIQEHPEQLEDPDIDEEDDDEGEEVENILTAAEGTVLFL